MQYTKGTQNKVVIKKTREYTAPPSSRVWNIEILQNNNVVYSIPNATDLSPYPDSYNEFIIDDAVANLSEGMATVVIKEGGVLYIEFIMTVNNPANDGSVVYINNNDYNIYNQ